MKAAAAALCVWGLAGCTMLVHPAERDLRDPVAVLLLKDVDHIALALPDRDGAYTQWGFGDLFYMTDHSWRIVPWSIWLGIVGLFGEPTTGALERIPLEGRTKTAIRRETGMATRSFPAERAAVDALRRLLECEFAAGTPVPLMPFDRRIDDNYSLYYDNCQSAVAGWCRELGADPGTFRLLPRLAHWSLKER